MEFGIGELIELLKPREVSIDKNCTVRGFSIDSRTIKGGEAFVGIRGGRFDGVDFACDAVRKAKTFAIVEKRINCPHMVVDDALEALKRLAAFKLKKSKAVSIAVVGSVGKTTTKELVADFLSCRYSVCRSFENENNAIGVCKTLLRVEDEDFCVVEVGINRPGEMEGIAAFFKPDNVLFLNVAPTHIGNFKNIEVIFEEKSKIIGDGAKLVYNADDVMLKEAFENRDNSFGFCFLHDCAFRAKGNERIQVKDTIFEKPFGLNPYTVLAAYSAAEVFGGFEDGECFKNKLASFEPVGYRMRREVLKDRLFILDCYNANVNSMKHAIDELSKLSGRKLAILGDMFELGDMSEEFHREVGRYLNNKGVELLAVGRDAFFIFEGFLGRKHYLKTKVEAVEFLRDRLSEYDVILLKASRGMRLEDIFEQLRGSQ
ncbi:UDP-N-acetylmuramoyl-tripeptide--D-alanyl-D-alanine ligase [Hippea sp. KM1]|uniref:UDP-N-acetylmuramoyl-tripeptide--D-alanyl-D- alanine ligase n=1 Tax=Hippea sp. KM1 TaxID=944481 RepID=UPI00046C9865|nr:UDP-N-acetylmuramoyl-tripeptide--D-alanyl-D-alanine ligase [Hippea sp. KM1]